MGSPASSRTAPIPSPSQTPGHYPGYLPSVPTHVLPVPPPQLPSPFPLALSSGPHSPPPWTSYDYSSSLPSRVPCLCLPPHRSRRRFLKPSPDQSLHSCGVSCGSDVPEGEVQAARAWPAGPRSVQPLPASEQADLSPLACADPTPSSLSLGHHLQEAFCDCSRMGHSPCAAPSPH